MGCMILEFLIWLPYEPDGLDRIDSDIVRQTQTATEAFQQESDASLRRVVI